MKLRVEWFDFDEKEQKWVKEDSGTSVVHPNAVLAILSDFESDGFILDSSRSLFSGINFFVSEIDPRIGNIDILLSPLDNKILTTEKRYRL